MTPVKQALADALSKRGYETLTPVQTACMDPKLGESDLLVSAQTGSGKTHTMIAPPNTFVKYDSNISDIPDEFGLFPRTIITIFNMVQGSNVILSVEAAEV